MILTLFSLPVFAWFLYDRGRALLMFFQQEEYSYRRFLVWWVANLAFDRLASVCYALAFATAFIAQEDQALLIISGVGMVLSPLLGIFTSRSVLKEAKKPLVLTARASRILLFFVGLGVTSFALSFWGFWAFGEALAWESLARMTGFLAIFVQLLPFIMILADLLLKPMEAKIKSKYLKEAKTKLTLLNPTIIGITGSFGKTSTKQILSHILGASAPTLATPGSVNTEMGITRIIREQLRPEHRYFIVEMGAYGPGSIARLCKLAPPHASLLTAVGAAHYERFKSLKAVAKTKFEIAEATITSGGPVVLSESGIPKEFRDDRMTAIAANYHLMGPNGQFELISTNQSAQGIEVVLKDHHNKEDASSKPEEVILRAPVFGLHQAENVAMAATMARLLGMPWGMIKAALANAPQTRHRLEVFKTPGQPTVLDDAYNSNPRGFAEALEVLKLLPKPEGKRILITPGMVELGAIHGAEHERLGALAAKACTHIMVVTPNRIPTFVKAIEAANTGVDLKTFATQAEAEAKAQELAGDGDAILYENNLPDLYEAKVRF